MKNQFLPEIIKKITSRKKKIITSDEIKSLIESIMKADYQDTRAYKIIYYLKKKGYLISLKKTIFYLSKPEIAVSEELLIQEYYRQILYSHCSALAGKDWYIGGFKALQLHSMDMAIPEALQIVTENIQRQEVVVSERIVQFKKYTTQGKSLFIQFKKHTTTKKLQSKIFRIAKKELAVLEVLYSFDNFEHQYELAYLKKFIKKYKDRDFSVWESILKLGKHHTSINRLYELFVQLGVKQAPELLECIRKFGFVL